MNISDHRKAIDRLDAQIVRLLNERTQHVLQIGDIKLKTGETPEGYEIFQPKGKFQFPIAHDQLASIAAHLHLTLREPAAFALRLKRSLQPIKPLYRWAKRLKLL